MNRKEYKLLFEGWRRLLNEEYGKFSAIDNLEKINRESGDHFKLLVYEEGQTVYVAYDRSYNKVDAGLGIIGMNDIEHADEGASKAVWGKTFAAPYTVKHDIRGSKGIGEGETNQTYEICLTTDTLSGQGLGSLMYEVLIEYISSRKNAGVKPDSRSITDEAKKVWEKFNARGDIQKIQLDLSDQDLMSLKNKFMGQKIEKLTPSNRQDDVIMKSAIEEMDIDWAESCLSKSYKKDNTELMDELEKRGLLIIVNNERSGFFRKIIKRIFGNQ